MSGTANESAPQGPTKQGAAQGPTKQGAAQGPLKGLSMTEATLKLLDFLAIEHDPLGAVRERSGNANQYSAPAAVFRTRDSRWVTLAGSTNALYANNCRAIGRPVVPRFANDPGRVHTTGGAIGCDNDEIYGHWLGLNPAEQQHLKDTGVI